MKTKIALHIIAVQRKLISERNCLQEGGSQLELAELDTFLRNEESIETLQREQGKNVNDLNLAYHLQTPPKIHRGDLFQNGNIHISKHRRYAEVPEHTHDFVEINYMYSGRCSQVINGERVDMEESDVVIIDKEATQRIEYTGQEDILINILLKEETLSTEILNHLASTNNLLSSFLINAAKEKGEHTQFIHFHGGKASRLTHLIENMLLIYFYTYSHKIRSLNLYISLLLIELTHLLEQQTFSSADGYAENEMLGILDYIDKHFTSCTLKETAAHFGYNPVYLSNKLKMYFDASFQELVLQKKFDFALELIQETSFSLEEIANRIGYKQTTSLFKLFKKYSTCTPNEWRNTR